MPNGEVPASLSLRSPPLLLARQLDTSDLANKPMQRAEPLQWSFLQANFPKADPQGRIHGAAVFLRELAGLLMARGEVPRKSVGRSRSRSA